MANAKTIREKILEALDAPAVPVSIPEWDIDAFLKPLDGDARYRLAHIAANTDHKKQNSYLVEAYVCESLVDEKGGQVFSIEERSALAKKNPAIIDRLYEKILEISGIGAKEAAAAEKK